ncbi:C-type lectin domain family 4 member A-like isoform X2 [Cavia porcellus]|uniref:C-type lectin domain family 4 member A-like isoform X2 n=1 Tax=Cavia porcellus TaxID=10141 RepID=UPI0006619776
MDLEITYAEVRFKTESKSSGTTSLSPDASKKKITSHQSNIGFPKLLLITLLILFLLLVILFLVAFIIIFHKYSQLLQEKKIPIESSKTHQELECIKTNSTTKGKIWSCCPKNWKSFSVHCYLFSNDFKTWNESAENCYRMEAHLVVINSKEEQDFIIQNLKIISAYVGLSDPEGQKQWQWVDHSPYNETAAKKIQKKDPTDWLSIILGVTEWIY